MNDLQKILEVDSPEGLETLAVKRIKEQNDSISKQNDEIEKLKNKIADDDPTKEPKEEPKEDPKEDPKEEPKDAEALKTENEELKKENEELKKTAEEKTDAVKKLEDSVEKLSKRTDAIGNKQVKPLFHNDDSEIEELKKARLNTYADSRKVK